MSWREILGVTSSTEAPYAHNSQNTQNSTEQGSCADIADSAYRGSDETPYAHNTHNTQKPVETGNCADIADSAYRGSEPESAPRYCATWHATPAALREICGAACDGLNVEPEELACWLEAQADNEWMTPPAARWWARHINLNGYPKD